MRRTKIIGTIGPASDSPEVIQKLLEAGLNVARLNMSHGDHAKHAQRISALRSVDPNIPILFDLQGPKIRTGKLRDGHVTLHRGSTITITTKHIEGDADIVSTTYCDLPSDVKAGDKMLIDDGLIELKVQKVVGCDVVCRVVIGGVLKDFKGLNLPGVSISAPGLTAKDRLDLDFAVKQKADFIAISFVRKAADVLKVKALLKQKRADIPVIAKIEKPEALQELDAVINAADGVMIARGDLGVELPPQKVPMVQKRIISACNQLGKPVITATQMLESMVVNPRPTRAEASDIANSVFDRTDALMLSEEVAVGNYPVEAVKMMSSIAEEAERDIFVDDYNPLGKNIVGTTAPSVAHAACHVASDLKAKAIVAFTSSGSTALLISKYRPMTDIFAVSISDRTFRRTKLYWGVTGVTISRFKSTEDMIMIAEKALLKGGYVKKGDIIVIVAGVPVGIAGTTNLIKVQKVGDVHHMGK